MLRCFNKTLAPNGHGSNRPFMDVAAGITMEKTHAIVATITPYSLVKNEITEICESEYISDAEELETSLMLYLDPDLVDTHKAVRDVNFPITQYHWRSLIDAPPLGFMDRWSRISKTGVAGDAILASAEKGEKIFALMVERMTELVLEFKNREIRDSVDHH